MLAAICLPSLAPAAAASELAFERCSIGNRQASLAVDCASLAVPLDGLEGKAGSADAGSANGASDDAAGNVASNDTLSLAIARVPARGRAPADDPLVFIAGGPGQSARDTFPAIASAFRQANRERDILLIDQRGTGGSNALGCPDDGDDIDSSPAEAAAAAARCVAALDDDPRHFTTAHAVDDLERVREALGIERWNLYGVSYGTRVAMHYARRHPDRVRTLVLDAVVPPGTPLGPDIAPLAQRAIDLILERCRDDAACGEAFPDIAARTDALLDALERSPRDVRWEDLVDGRLRETALERSDLAVTLRLLAYSAWGASLLPSMLDDAIEHDHLAPFARQAQLQSRALSDTLATGMHLAVICSEDLPFMDADTALADAMGTFLGSAPLESQIAACSAWPRGRLDDDLHTEASLSIPSLLLSGEADPVTPPAYGERAAAMLGADVRHLVNEGQGHMQATLGCMPALIATFLQAGTTEGLETDCLERLSAPPFFVDANGPRP